MLTSGNMRPRRTLPVISAGGVMSLLLITLLTAPLGAQQQAPSNDLQAGLEAPLVAPSHGVRAYNRVEQWVRQGEVPDAEAADERIEVTGLLGVRVTLRLDGMTIGRGDAYRPDPEAVLARPAAAIDLVTLLRPATEQALVGVRQNLRDAHRQALTEQYSDQAPEALELTDVAGRLTVDIQLAHQPEPIEIPTDAEMAAVLAAFAPGYHGLWSPAAGGQVDEAIIWPATAIASQSSPRGQLMRLLDARGRDPQGILELGRPGGLPLMRFEVVHVVQSQPHLPVRHLVRGHELLPPRSISSRTLDGMTARLAEHLQRRFTSRNLVRGTYHPTSHRYDPDVAETRDVGLASYALMRYAQHRARMRGEDATEVREAADAARAAAVLLGRTLLEQDEAQKPAGAALALLTLVEDLEPGAHNELRDQLAATLLGMYEAGEGADEGGAFHFVGDDGDRGTVTQGTAAVITAALAALYEQTRDERVGEVVSEQMGTLWAQTERRPNAAALPWLVLAHHRAAHLLADSSEAGAQLAERERGFGAMVQRLIDHQVTEPPAFGPADVVGGFELATGPGHAPPSPDWRTAHMLSYLALSLREPGVIADHEPLDWVLSGALAGRFIAQLMMDDTGCYYVRSLPEAIGGVRMAMWDNRLPVSATAMSLLACVQFQETLERHAGNFGR